MDQLKSFADTRLMVGCFYCSAATESREHIPSRVLLDKPYPENLPVMPSCLKCNENFSLDEEYFACLVECARAGAVEAVKRPKIRKILEDSPLLAERITRARTVSSNGEVFFTPESERVRNVIVKLARGHAAYELDAQEHSHPKHVAFAPIHILGSEDLQRFENSHRQGYSQLAGWPEVGARAMQRMRVVTPDNLILGNDWMEVQVGQYRYLVIDDEGDLIVRFVIGEYLACEVIWRERNQS
jgi:hypothetical protein